MGWIGPHITGMSASYILLLIAFYLDNGKNLSLRRELPYITSIAGPRRLTLTAT
jgi:hypothetical protein